VLRRLLSYVNGRTQIRSVWTWQINSTVFNVWSATRVGPRTDTFSLILSGSHTVDESLALLPHLTTTRFAALSAPPVSRRRCPSASTRFHSGCEVIDTTKTDILWRATSRRQHQIPRTPTRTGCDYVMTARSVPVFGIYLDAGASMTTHVTKFA